MEKISKKANFVSSFPNWQLQREANTLIERGLDIINMGAEEPDFSTPLPIIKALKRAIEEGFTNYAPPGGIFELKEAIARFYQKYEGVQIVPEELIITNGASQALWLALLSILDSNEDILIPVPYWSSYPEMVRLAGGNPIFIPYKENFYVNLEEIKKNWTKKTKALLISSPINPSGNIIKSEDLEEMVNLCMEQNAYLIVDESFKAYVYPPAKFYSVSKFFEKFKENIFLAGSFSKTYAMAGWRIGYGIGSQKLIDTMVSIQSSTSTGPPTFCQVAAIEALSFPPRFYQKLKEEFATRKALALELCSKVFDTQTLDPQSTFYILPSIKKFIQKGTIKDSSSLAGYLLREGLTYVVPSICFGLENHIRISFALPQSKIKEGFRRINQALSLLI